MILDTASHTKIRNHLGRSEGLTPINVKTSASISNPAIQLIVTMNIISPLLTAPRPPSSWINYTAAFLRIHQLCTDSPPDWSQNRPMCGCDDHSLTVSSAESDSLVLSDRIFEKAFRFCDQLRSSISRPIMMAFESSP